MASPFPMDFGPYVLDRFIAAGGMAEVFLGRSKDGSISGPLCVKRMLPEMMSSAEYITMFKDEARLSQRLQHPNVVRVFDFGEADGRMYMAMEYVDGMDVGSLQRRLRQRGEMLGVGHALQIGIELCAGLHYAHALGVDLVHRDVSPQNILISSAGAVKVTDFGIAKAVGRETHTATGLVKGKVSYMAPEQALGQDIDQRVDQFAAGIVVWELVTGQRLYAEKTDNLNFEKIIRQPPPRPSQTRKGVPPVVDGAILRALAKRPADRYPDCAAFGAALKQALAVIGPAAKTDIGAVMAHVLGIPPKELREAAKPRAIAAPAPQVTRPGAPAPRARALQVTPLEDAPTVATPQSKVRHDLGARLPTNAMMPLPEPEPTAPGTPATPSVAAQPRVVDDGDTIYDPPSTLEVPPDDVPSVPTVHVPPPAPARTPQGPVAAPAQAPPPAAQIVAVTPPRAPVAARPAPMSAAALPVPSTAAPAPAPAESGRGVSFVAVAGALVVGLAAGFGVAHLTGRAPAGATGCPLSSPQEEARTKAASLVEQARDAFQNGDAAGADRLAEESERASGSAAAEMLRGDVALAHGERLSALTHYRCVAQLDPGGVDAAALVKRLSGP